MTNDDNYIKEASDYLCGEYETIKKMLSSYGLITDDFEKTAGHELYKKDGSKQLNPDIKYVIHCFVKAEKEISSHVLSRKSFL